MSKPIYIDYTINLTDPDQVTKLQAALTQVWYPPNSPITQSGAGLVTLESEANIEGLLPGWTPGVAGVGMVFGAPGKVATVYNAPVISTTDAFSPPCITSPWIVAGHAGPGLPIDTTLDYFMPDSQITGDPFADQKWIWRGTFKLAQAQSLAVAPGTGIIKGTIAQRLWSEGFEHPEQGNGGSGTGAQQQYTRAASRHADGYGLQIRGISGSQYGDQTHSTTEQGGSAPSLTWERLYIRPIVFPNAAQRFWRSRSTVSGSKGLTLNMLPTGSIQAVSTDASGNPTTLASFGPLTLLEYYKLDILMNWGSGGGAAAIYINGVQQLDINGVGGLDTSHASSSVGDQSGSGATLLAMDIDDWDGALMPAVPPPTPVYNWPPLVPSPCNNSADTWYPAPDWAGGTKIVRVDASTFDVDNVFAGDPRTAPQTPADAEDALMTSSTSGALLTFQTNSKLAVDDVPGSLGCVAFTVGKFGLIGSPGNGELGYSVAAAADVKASITETNTGFVWSTTMYRPSGMTSPAPVSPIRLVYQKAANTALASVACVTCSATLCGTFQNEDVVPSADGSAPQQIQGNTGVHNSPYPTTPWAIAGLPPLSAVQIFAGTYTGNGVGLDLEFENLINWIFVRRVTPPGNTGVEGDWWWTSMVGNHQGTRQNYSPSFASLVEVDTTDVPDPTTTSSSKMASILRIAGANTWSNANGETYQYVAISDPGMRFLLNACLLYPYGSPARTTPLVNTNFLAEALFAMLEAGGTNNVGSFYKGLGHLNGDISPLANTLVSNVLTIARGSLTSQGATLHFAGSGTSQGVALTMVRRADGNNDPNQNAVFQLATYTGNGAGNRVINLLNPTGANYPLLAFVVPHDNSLTVFRDPSHTGTNSTQVPATNLTANGIVAGGVDAITVGSDLNANGVVYDVFVVVGGTSANLAGFSNNGTFEPVAPALPADGPFEQPLPFDTSVLVLPGAGGGGGSSPGGEPGGDDFGTQCLGASTAVINQALLYIGVTRGIVNVLTDNTPESIAAALVYDDCVETVLRDFDWPFATGYAQLNLVAGSLDAPVNNDWVYSFRAPADMVKGRRIVKDAQIGGYGREPDNNPVKWRKGTDTLGELIFTNYPGIPSLEIAGGGSSSQSPANVAGNFQAVGTPTLEYTFRPSCAASLGDALFRDALAFQVASRLAPGLSRNKVTASECLQAYVLKLSDAARVAANEGQPTTRQTNARWIDARQ